MTVQPATRDDVDGVSRVLARAFYDDPVMSWVFPNDDTRETKLRRLYAAALRKLWLRNELVYTTSDHLGAAVWAPPGKWRMNWHQTLRAIPTLLSIAGGQLGRVLAASRTIERNHLSEPHYYLFIIGTGPDAQGRGIGRALMEPVLARCDAERVPAYLESSNPRNLSFYVRHGFRALREVAIPDGPSLTLMRRDPQ